MRLVAFCKRLTINLEYEDKEYEIIRSMRFEKKLLY